MFVFVGAVCPSICLGTQSPTSPFAIPASASRTPRSFQGFPQVCLHSSATTQPEVGLGLSSQSLLGAVPAAVVIKKNNINNDLLRYPRCPHPCGSPPGSLLPPGHQRTVQSARVPSDLGAFHLPSGRAGASSNLGSWRLLVRPGGIRSDPGGGRRSRRPHLSPGPQEPLAGRARARAGLVEEKSSVQAAECRWQEYFRVQEKPPKHLCFWKEHSIKK